MVSSAVDDIDVRRRLQLGRRRRDGLEHRRHGAVEAVGQFFDRIGACLSLLLFGRSLGIEPLLFNRVGLEHLESLGDVADLVFAAETEDVRVQIAGGELVQALHRARHRLDDARRAKQIAQDHAADEADTGDSHHEGLGLRALIVGRFRDLLGLVFGIVVVLGGGLAQLRREGAVLERFGGDDFARLVLLDLGAVLAREIDHRGQQRLVGLIGFVDASQQFFLCRIGIFMQIGKSLFELLRLIRDGRGDFFYGLGRWVRRDHEFVAHETRDVLVQPRAVERLIAGNIDFARVFSQLADRGHAHDTDRRDDRRHGADHQH